jgi:hypothetical protein
MSSASGNGRGQGLGHALEVLKHGEPAQKLKALELLARLGDMHPPDRLRAIPFRPQFFRQFVQPPLSPVRLDVLERLAIHARRTTIELADAVGVPEHIRPVHLVI